tara:strand:+ start:336 stop:839 length:504 start_codon:yes stop_codon:yes gene_type:complete
MVLDASISKQFNPLNFLGNTTSFIFDSEKRNSRILNKAITDSQGCLDLLITFLEDINVNDYNKDDESIDKSLDIFKLLSKMLHPLSNALKSMAYDAEQNNDPLFHKYRLIGHINSETLFTINKIIDKIHDLQENKLVSEMHNLNLSANDDLWDESDDSELRELFLNS